MRELTYLRDKVKNRIETRQKMKGHIIQHLDREVERHTDVLARATTQEQELTQGRGQPTHFSQINARTRAMTLLML